MAFDALQGVGIRVANGEREHAMFDGPGAEAGSGVEVAPAFAEKTVCFLQDIV
ncbi:MAG: hypothetical protein OSB65_02855 [Roseibacillus sp.]|jgi:hypothetical protein|nr:hypothetical protein [Roseibacillus sp.]